MSTPAREFKTSQQATLLIRTQCRPRAATESDLQLLAGRAVKIAMPTPASPIGLLRPVREPCISGEREGSVMRPILRRRRGPGQDVFGPGLTRRDTAPSVRLPRRRPTAVEDRKGTTSDMGQQGAAGMAVQTGRRVTSAARQLRPRELGPQVEPVPPLQDAAEGRIERLCTERGLKMTGQRRIIARVLSEASDHPDVEELYRRAALLDGRISIATVYRTVRLLEENGILQRRDFGQGRARYEPAEHGHHYHLIDVETGRVVEFRNSEHERLVRALAEQLGFAVVSLRLEVFGKRLEVRPAPGQDAAADHANGEAHR